MLVMCRNETSYIAYKQIESKDVRNISTFADS
jgi:hypothetical protein